MQDYSYIQKHYGVPAKYGREVSYKGRKGLIVESQGQYIGVTFDDENPSKIHTLHPTDEVDYLDIGKPRKLTASQRKYRQYQNADCGLTFSQWLGIKN